jgi:NAD(P)-dependent dehydrogenase (short-subunit alcohol dehydrogenase family)
MTRSSSGDAMRAQRIILVTGATRGIGRAVALGLGDRGETVVVGARDLAPAELLASEVGNDSIGVQLEVTDEESIASSADRIRQVYGCLDGLVNNAGINAGWDLPPSRAQLSDIRRIFEVDVIGVFAVTRAMLPLLRVSDSPRIVNVSSTRGSLGLVNQWIGPWSLGYGTAKATLNAITAHLSNELRSSNFAVTAVSPGHVATDLTAGSAPLTPEQGARQIIATVLANDTELDGKFIDENGNGLPW